MQNMKKKRMGIFLLIYEQTTQFYTLVCLGCPRAKPLGNFRFTQQKFLKKKVEKNLMGMT